MVDAALRTAPDMVASEGRIHLGRTGRGISVTELRRMWDELKAAGVAELVSVEEEGQTVNVTRRAGLVSIRVEQPPGKEQVCVEVPVLVVDALLSGGGDTLNVRAAIKKMQEQRGDIVRVSEEKGTVRVWIDEKN